MQKQNKRHSELTAELRADTLRLQAENKCFREVINAK